MPLKYLSSSRRRKFKTSMPRKSCWISRKNSRVNILIWTKRRKSQGQSTFSRPKLTGKE